MDALERELDRLFQLPLSEFVSTRNELAASLKREGRPEESKRVKELPKPSLSAWAVNQLYWKERGDFDALVEAGDRYRSAHKAALSGKGTDLFERAEDERREAMKRALHRIDAILADAGQTASAAVSRRITTTLEALASFGSAYPDPFDGRLTADLQSPGFGALASLAPEFATAVEPPPSSGASSDGARERAALALKHEEDALAESLRELERAAAEAQHAASAVEAAREQLRRAEAAHELAAERVGEARRKRAEQGKRVEEARRLWEDASR